MAPGQKGSMTEKTLEDLQAKLDKALASIEKLSTKNSELIDREKSAKQKADEAEAARDEAAQEAAAKSGDVETVKASLERKHQAELKKLTDQVSARDTRLGELLIDNAIKEAITSNNVLPQYAKAVEAMLRAGAKIENGEAVSADGSALTDANAVFFKSEDAKHFIAAPANTGSGAQGSSAKGGGSTKLPETADDWTAFMKMSADNPAQANALADQWGRPDLKV